MPDLPTPVAALFHALRTGEAMPDAAVIQLVQAEPSPRRMKQLANGLHAAGVISADQLAFVIYLFPSIAGA